MPTSSQSRILSVVDHHLHQQSTGHDGTSVQLTTNVETRRGSVKGNES